MHGLTKALTPDEHAEYQRQCGGRKVRHTQQKFALSHAAKMHAKTGEHFHAYECEYCGYWHIGHTLPPHVRAQRDGRTAERS